MDEYFNARSKMLIYEYLIGTTKQQKEPVNKEVLKDYKNWFSHLPPEKQASVIENYKQLDTYLKKPVTEKIKQGFSFLVKKMPLLEQAWILLGLAIPILLLFRKESAKPAAWALPLLTAYFGIDKAGSHSALLIYFSWNILFAYLVNKNRSRKSKIALRLIKQFMNPDT